MDFWLAVLTLLLTATIHSVGKHLMQCKSVFSKTFKLSVPLWWNDLPTSLQTAETTIHKYWRLIMCLILGPFLTPTSQCWKTVLTAGLLCSRKLMTSFSWLQTSMDSDSSSLSTSTKCYIKCAVLYSWCFQRCVITGQSEFDKCNFKWNCVYFVCFFQRWASICENVGTVPSLPVLRASEVVRKCSAQTQPSQGPAPAARGSWAWQPTGKGGFWHRGGPWADSQPLWPASIHAGKMVEDF